MPEKIIKTIHEIRIVTEIPFPEAFPNMNLAEAVEFQENLDLDSAMDSAIVGSTTMNTTVETVQGDPAQDETTRAASCPPCPCPPHQCKGDDHG